MWASSPALPGWYCHYCSPRRAPHRPRLPPVPPGQRAAACPPPAADSGAVAETPSSQSPCALAPATLPWLLQHVPLISPSIHQQLLQPECTAVYPSWVPRIPGMSTAEKDPDWLEWEGRQQSSSSQFHAAHFYIFTVVIFVWGSCDVSLPEWERGPERGRGGMVRGRVLRRDTDSERGREGI